MNAPNHPDGREPYRVHHAAPTIGLGVASYRRDGDDNVRDVAAFRLPQVTGVDGYGLPMPVGTLLRGDRVNRWQIHLNRYGLLDGGVTFHGEASALSWLANTIVTSGVPRPVTLGELGRHWPDCPPETVAGTMAALERAGITMVSESVVRAVRIVTRTKGGRQQP